MESAYRDVEKCLSSQEHLPSVSSQKEYKKSKGIGICIIFLCYIFYNFEIKPKKIKVKK